MLRQIALAFSLLASATLTLGCAPKRFALATARPPSPAVEPQKELVCTYTYGGESKELRVPPTRDPYGVRAQNVADRFELKVVYVEAPADVAGVRVYTYSSGPDGPALIHEAKYRAPYAEREQGGFTGQQLIYDPRGRELTYYCQWIRR